MEWKGNKGGNKSREKKENERSSVKKGGIKGNKGENQITESMFYIVKPEIYLEIPPLSPVFFLVDGKL